MISLSGLPGVVWRKSSYSSSNGGDCVEVASGLSGVVPVRDSKRPAGPVLVFASGAWAGFIAFAASRDDQVAR
ncbi:DUF397 domain-containing protein [Streptomyces sp. AK02-01A]|uniref:DUF397 domain-containing protein n=1 Tax=Streptomyces sp. AK02-01A TaxID=3028648 RepID=UPI0029B7AA16|nr:DUF397 domain-containing protein [Streptomyces sp. AK02-01A]MDX3854437.1 DUF397 domain-containing protein [Streptomyces sp. AK02-01A]